MVHYNKRYLSCLPDSWCTRLQEFTSRNFNFLFSLFFFVKHDFLFSIPHSWRICRFNLKTVANSQTVTAKVLQTGVFTTILPPQWWVACKCTKCLPRRSSNKLTTTIKIRILPLQTLQIRISNTSTRKYKTIWWTWALTRTDTLIINQIHHNLCHRTWGNFLFSSMISKIGFFRRGMQMKRFPPRPMYPHQRSHSHHLLPDRSVLFLTLFLSCA